MGVAEAIRLVNVGNHTAGHFAIHANTSTIEAIALQTIPDCVPILIAELDRLNEAPDEYDPDVIEARCKLRKEQNRVVGVPALPVFQPQVQAKLNAVIDKYRTFPDYTDLMNEAARHVRAEPPHFAQALYSEFLSPAVQKVLIDEEADPRAIMSKAAADFDKQYLAPMNEEILKK